MCMFYGNCKRRVCERGAPPTLSFRDAPKAQARNPYPPAAVMDSGLAANAAPRNDEWREWWGSARRHASADFGAQLVDQPQALLGLDMPEGPAVAGFRALRHRAHAVDRADLVAEHDGAVGADQG